MLSRPFGSTSLTVSALGLGAGQVGDASLSDDAAASLLHGALDAGITLIDTARGYGLSEERIGRHLAAKRDRFILSSKCGYGIPGFDDWTGPCITAGIDAALARLRTDRIDIMHLHSCPLETLQKGDVIDALTAAVRAGKVRVSAYSGENEALDWAIHSGFFAGIQTSVNICDQRSLRDMLPEAARRGIGVIAKRPIANGFWRHADRPVGNYSEVYWCRARDMGLSPGALPWDEYALRFSAFAPGVHSVIVGTSRLEALRSNAAIIAKGPLPEAVTADITARFSQSGASWAGEI